MDAFLQQLTSDPLGRLLLQFVANDGMARMACALLVVARLAGLLCVGPLLGRALFPWQVRVGLTVLLAMVIAPTLPIEADSAPVRLVHDETDGATSLPQYPMTSLMQIVQSPLDFAQVLVCELLIGATLGLGVAVVLSGLKLGGEWLDRHTGLGMGGVVNPEYLSGGSASAEMLMMFGIASLLLIQPQSGHLLFLRTLMETFRSLPVGMSILPGSLGEMLNSLVGQSLVLALRIAMPIVVAMSLLDMTFGFVSRSSRWSLVPTVYAVRTAAGLLLLAVTWPGIAEAISTTILDSLRIANDVLLVERTSP